MKKAEPSDPRLPAAPPSSAGEDAVDHGHRSFWRLGRSNRHHDMLHHDAPPHDELEHPGQERDPHAPRTFLQKTFSVDLGGWARLAAASLLAGAVIETANIDVFSPDFNLAGAMGAIVRALGDLGLWAIANAWMPLIFGALAVLPLWVIWRLLSSPFRH